MRQFRIGLASESAGWDLADLLSWLVSRQSGGLIPLLLWPEDPAQSPDLLRLLEARLADGHRYAKQTNTLHHQTISIDVFRVSCQTHGHLSCLHAASAFWSGVSP